MKLYPKNISSLRSLNQQITFSKFKTAKEIVQWMVAVQAQDYNMAKWALGIRLQDSTETVINNEIDSGRILRTHLLRPTWHFVSSDDIYWLLELSGSKIKSSLKHRDRQLGLTDSIYRKCNRIFEKTLRDGNHKTREELIKELVSAGVDVDDNRASHIFQRAEIEMLICSGKQKEGKPSYAILEEWVPVRRKLSGDEALKELALRYFTSRGPATIQDFTWWSGLSAGNSKLALDLSKSGLISETIADKTYWFSDNPEFPDSANKEIFLLPAFDEFLIAYSDRTPSLLSVNNRKAISDNGIFYPVILKGGQITGTWKRIIRGNRIILTIKEFKTGTTDPGKLFRKAVHRYSKFYNKEIEIIGTDRAH